MRSFAKLLVVGFSGVVLLKLFASVLIPVLGLLAGLVALALKLAVLAAVVYFVYALLRKREEDDELHPDKEIVVEDVPEEPGDADGDDTGAGDDEGGGA